ncbi:transaminase [Acetobacter malorum]|nr:transaminase [Acetobacter malorum]
MARKRDILSAGLRGVGLEVLPCDGSYFVMADITPLANGQDDVAFARMLTEEAGVTTIPASAFYDPSNGSPPTHLVRFAFCKQESVLQEAVARIERWASQRG